MTTAQNLVVIGVERPGREGPPMTKIVMSAFSYGSLEQGQRPHAKRGPRSRPLSATCAMAPSPLGAAYFG